VGTYHLAPLINTFSRQFPGVDIQMKVKNKKGVIDDILSLSDDVGFVGNVPVNPNLAVTPLWKEELVVIAKSSHSFGRTSAIRPADLSHQPLIVREKGSGTREYIEARLKRHGVAIKTVMEIGSDEAIKRAVAVGLGISIVPVGVVAKEVKRRLIKPYRMDGETLYLEYFMIWHKDKYLSNLIRAFMDATVGHFKHMMADPKPPPGTAAAGRRRTA
jgi:DNA-binding transcriptional LysR family regulator